MTTEMRQSFPYLSETEFYAARGLLRETHGEVYAKDIPDAVRELERRDAAAQPRRGSDSSPSRADVPGHFAGRSRAAQRLSTQLRTAFQSDRVLFQGAAPEADAERFGAYWFMGGAPPAGVDVLERLVRRYLLLSGGQWTVDLLIRAACAHGRVTARMLPTLRPVGVVREQQTAPSMGGGMTLLTHQTRLSVVCVTGDPTRREWLDAWQAARQMSRQPQRPGRRPDVRRDERLLTAIAAVAGTAGPPPSPALAFWKLVARASGREVTANAARLWWGRRGRRLHAHATRSRTSAQAVT